MGRVQVGLYYFIIFLFFYFFYQTRLNFGQKILIHTRPDRVTGRPDPACVK
jgi:hypothetical protein